LLELIGKREMGADVLVVPGDVTNKACPEGLQHGWQLMMEVCAALRAQALVGTIGNHDVNVLKKGGREPLELPKNAHPTFPVPDSPEGFWSDGIWVRQYNRLEIVSINSIADFDEQKCKRGHLRTGLIDKLRERLQISNGCVRIAICHHHPTLHSGMNMGTDDVLEQGDQLLETLGELGFSLLIHGHKHSARLIKSPHGGHLYILASGALSGLCVRDGLRTNVRNLFHLVTLDPVSGAGSPCRGLVETWQFMQDYGWRPALQGATHFPATTGFGAQRTPHELAASTAEWFDSQGLLVQPWNAVIESESEVRYLTPQEFREYEQTLLQDYGVEVWRNEDGLLRSIGRPSGGGPK
jgi:predicted phosphodiesterase